MTDPAARRPIAARNWAFIRTAARKLAARGVTPNQISLASIAFSAVTALCLCLLPLASPVLTGFLCILALLGLGGRGLCNLCDGLVAVEGGRGTKSGELFNDIPDRIADALILAAAGYATLIVPWAAAAGWCAAVLAVMTAYVRTLARGLGAPVDFQGPMAKARRMAIIATACAITPFEPLLALPSGLSFLIALLVIIVGCVVTVWRRARAAQQFLEGRP